MFRNVAILITLSIANQMICTQAFYDMALISPEKYGKPKTDESDEAKKGDHHYSPAETVSVLNQLIRDFAKAHHVELNEHLMPIEEKEQPVGNDETPEKSNGTTGETVEAKAVSEPEIKPTEETPKKEVKVAATPRAAAKPSRQRKAKPKRAATAATK